MFGLIIIRSEISHNFSHIFQNVLAHSNVWKHIHMRDRWSDDAEKWDANDGSP